MTLTYLLANLSSLAIPLAYSFHPRLRFASTWPAFWPATLATAAVFIAWDVLYTHWGVWGFNPKYLTGLYALGLPLEEWLFFICIPYACVFTYHCLKVLIKKDYLAPSTPAISWTLVAALSALALFNLERIYTSVTFAATAALLLVHLLLIKGPYLGRFYLAYGAIIAPFLLVNGLLTGSFTDEAVVWYDDSQNLSLRVFTIPVEDFFYALLLLLTNVTLYESLLARKNGRPNG